MPAGVGYGIPENYNYINMYNSCFSPSTVHVKNTALQKFFMFSRQTIQHHSNSTLCPNQ